MDYLKCFCRQRRQREYEENKAKIIEQIRVAKLQAEQDFIAKSLRKFVVEKQIPALETHIMALQIELIALKKEQESLTGIESCEQH